LLVWTNELADKACLHIPDEFLPPLPRIFQTFWRGKDGNAGIFGISCDALLSVPIELFFFYNPDRAFLFVLGLKLGESVNAASDRYALILT
jgi:hypothetical protein